MYLLRLDDASEYMDVLRWKKIEELLDTYEIWPIVGVIPDNKDPELVGKYDRNPQFWAMAKTWQDKGWAIALHGHTHVYESQSGGINPVNNRSEFAGLSLDAQREKIREGILIFNRHGIKPELFFAPAHTFDGDTLRALKLESQIRVISDTVAHDIYYKDGFYFIPQQAGMVRRLPFKVVTFCYHPNNMGELGFKQLEDFIRRNKARFGSFRDLSFTNRDRSKLDHLLSKSYFCFRRIRSTIR